MNICYPVETEQGTPDSLHGQFRLAPRYLVYNTDTNETNVIENKLNKDDHGIEIPLKSLAGFSVNAAIVGGISRCDLVKLNEHGIKVFRAIKLNMKDNINELKEGGLTELTPTRVNRGYPCR